MERIQRSIGCVLALMCLGGNLFGQLLENKTANLPPQTLGTWTMDAEAADLDGDGDLELILANEFNENYVLFNDGNGVFSIDPDRRLPKTYPSTPSPGEDSEDIAVADFDRMETSTYSL